MERRIKERYLYSPAGRYPQVTAPFAGSSQTVRAEMQIPADLYRSEAPSAEYTQSFVSRHPLLGQDPLVEQNLTAPQADGVEITIPAPLSNREVLFIHLYYPTAGEYVWRTAVRMETGSQARLVVYHHPCGETSTRINSLTTIECATGARIEVTEIAETRATLLSSIITLGAKDSHTEVTVIDLDNEVLRRNQFVSLQERGAECHLEGVFLTGGEQHADNHVQMHHPVTGCTSSQMFKGVAGGRSHGAFTGHIHVAPNAQQTVALQENHNIVLDDRAHIDTRPQLEIYADDVKCNHGATLGHLDAEAVYYMRQRGMSENAAHRLQIEGFIDEIIDHSHVESLGEELRNKVSARLEQL